MNRFTAAYLAATGIDHPLRENGFAAQPTDWASESCEDRVGADPGKSPVWYQKHMSHHMDRPFGYEDFAAFTHAFLIRAPEQMLASYLQNARECRVRRFRARAADRDFDREADRLGHAPAVIDANDVLADPQGGAVAPVLRLSTSRGIPRCSTGRPAAVRRTARGRRTGTPRSRRAPASARLSRRPSICRRDARRLAERCRPYYEAPPGAHRISRRGP